MNWDHLRYFIALARHKTLTKAGKSLRVSHATIYRKIKAFEEELGVTLFENTSNGYVLTSAAEHLLDRMDPIETAIESTLGGLMGMDQRIQGNIRLGTTDTVACKHLAHILPKFQKTYPELMIELKINQDTVSLSKREVDIAIRISREPPPNLIGRKVGSVPFAVFAAESYLEEHGIPQFPEQGDHHHFIVLDEQYSELLPKQWLDQQIEKATKVSTVNSMLTLMEMCNAGMGVATLPIPFVVEGKTHLKTICPIPETVERHVWILTHRDLMRSARIRLTTEFFFQELKVFF